jgi:hypothetical protein
VLRTRERLNLVRDDALRFVEILGLLCEISSSHGGEYDVRSCLLGCNVSRQSFYTALQPRRQLWTSYSVYCLFERIIIGWGTHWVRCLSLYCIVYWIHCLPSATGHCIPLRIVFIFRTPKSVRYVSICSLQSAGEAQSGHTGYQTDTRHIRTGLWGWDRPTGREGTDSQVWGTVHSHAETTERLYTAPPGDNTVRLQSSIKLVSGPLIKYYLM